MKKAGKKISNKALNARLDKIEVVCGDVFNVHSRLLVAAGKAANLAAVINRAIAHNVVPQSTGVIASAAAEVEITLHAVRCIIGDDLVNNAKNIHLISLENRAQAMKRTKDSLRRLRR